LKLYYAHYQLNERTIFLSKALASEKKRICVSSSILLLTFTLASFLLVYDEFLGNHSLAFGNGGSFLRPPEGIEDLLPGKLFSSLSLSLSLSTAMR